MNKILYLSKDINENNDKTALSKMAEAEKEIIEINKKVPKLLEEMESIPDDNDMNTRLLKETIKRAMSYKREPFGVREVSGAGKRNQHAADLYRKKLIWMKGNVVFICSWNDRCR